MAAPLVLRTKHHKPRTANHEPQTTNHEPQTTNHKQRTTNQEPRTNRPRSPISIRLRKEITGEFWLILGGLISVAFGVFVAVAPIAGAFAVGTIIGIYALVFGVLLIMLALRLRKHASRAASQS